MDRIIAPVQSKAQQMAGRRWCMRTQGYGNVMVATFVDVYGLIENIESSEMNKL